MPETLDIPIAPDRATIHPIREDRPILEPIAKARDRRVVLLAVHHVEVDGRTYTGGAEKYIQTVIRALLDAGARVHVGYSGTSIYSELLESYHPRQLTVEHTGWLNPALAGDARLSLSTFLDRRRWLRATRADTVFAVQQAGGCAFVTSLIAARSLGFRVVATLRQSPEPLPAIRRKRTILGMFGMPGLWHLRKVWQKRLPASVCHALIYNSRTVANRYESLYGFPESTGHVIYNGEQGHAQPHASADPPIRIASVGRVTEAKGADVLLDAFSIVARRYPHARLTYYGDGDLIPRLARMANEQGLIGRVAFAGYVPSRSEIFPTIDICVQPSRRESMSNGVIEAQARGIPCVVADVGGMRESVVDGESGYVVPQDDATACAEAICRLMADRERYTRFSRAAAARAKSEFDLRDLMLKTINVILGLESQDHAPK
ncbi:MAG: glycosyltransferase family 4 protein [Planctomycetes bacterium]|nr:glycosyltransferase family 4 protein [Planctomycetota bacterium]